jgi:metal-responsive CopG/Arc/MetJ family transcriptional regulator
MRERMAQPSVVLLLPPSLLERLDTEAKRSGRNRSEVMRSAMRRGLEVQDADRASKPPACERCAAARDTVRLALEQLDGGAA